jgi:hypothetical protein
MPKPSDGVYTFKVKDLQSTGKLNVEGKFKTENSI